MKTLCAGLLMAIIIGAGLPAAADVVEITTSVSMPDRATDGDVKDALRAAVASVATEVSDPHLAIIAITAAYVSAGRLYVRFILADEAGARSLGVWDQATGNRPDAGNRVGDSGRDLRI